MAPVVGVTASGIGAGASGTGVEGSGSAAGASGNVVSGSLVGASGNFAYPRIWNFGNIASCLSPNCAYISQRARDRIGGNSV